MRTLGLFRERSARRGRRGPIVAVGASLALALAAVLPVAAAPSAASSDVAKLASLTAVHGQLRSVDPGTMASLARANGASVSDIAAIAASSACWSDSGYVQGKNILGWVIFQYNESHDWCGSGGYITYAVPNSWASNTNWGWTYKPPDTKTSTYGMGWNVWKEHYSGHFCYVEYFSCVNNAWPWIEFYVGGGGQQYYWHWG